jgi:diguanylate cyclase (GGDEF)-like protein/PAS domain S-box-containing protein
MQRDSRIAAHAARPTLRSRREQESDGFYAAVFDQVVIGTALVELDGTLSETNQAFQRFLGYTAEELRGMSWTELTHPDDMTPNRHLFDAVTGGRISHYTLKNRYIAKDGSTLWGVLTVSVVRDDAGDPRRMIALVEDIREHKEQEARVRQLAHYDALTELPNRARFREVVEHALARAELIGEHAALVLCDVDQFKAINELFGHAAGDALLRRIADGLRKIEVEPDGVARLGSDEFGILLTGAQNITAAVMAVSTVLEHLRRLFAEPIELDGREIVVRPSIGVALWPQDAGPADELVVKAESALHHSKKHARQLFAFFSNDMAIEAEERFQLHVDLRRAIENNELHLVFQPQYRTAPRAICGVETLVRWSHTERGDLSPVDFLEVAEDSGLIVDLDRWVIQNAIAAARRWLDAGVTPRRLAINVSPTTFREENPARLIAAAAEKAGVDPRLIEIEITEGALMHDVRHAAAVLGDLQTLGVGVALDDFGTGYSSLSYLHRLPIDRLKIDRSFVGDFDSKEDSTPIVETMIALGKSLEICVLAEGVETDPQLVRLQALGCEQVQGYLFSGPQSEQDCLATLSPR